MVYSLVAHGKRELLRRFKFFMQRTIIKLERYQQMNLHSNFPGRKKTFWKQPKIFVSVKIDTVSANTCTTFYTS